ncbi:hypothetical protein IV203_031158 [Nitzschia inconspicua]|uniref:Uncharacterized protein n=1 Tax=Nitzschia inconspicua TaxID=303405 RepID=A0A9K3LV45_9STRA|nr:hypothetical protein IV203_031158 [Nitzschia inconspicua]
MKVNQRGKRCCCQQRIGNIVLVLAMFSVALLQYRLASMEQYHRHPSVPERERRIQNGHRNGSTTTGMAEATAVPSASIPDWMNEYLKWHREMRTQFLTLDNWKLHRNISKLLILQCMPSNAKCGGLADRLKPLPLLMLGAFQSKRLLLIRWKDRPAKLEEFLVPPKNAYMSFDWRVPDWLDEELGMEYQNWSRRHIVNVQPFIKTLHQSSNKDIVTTTMQWWDGGEQAYKDALNSTKRDDEFRRVYHHLFRIFFVPVEPIRQRLWNIYKYTALGDENGNPVDYAVAHYRALWWEDQALPTWKEQVDAAQNAVDCASGLMPKHPTMSGTSAESSANRSRPIYFATDSIDAQNIVVNYARSKSRQIVVIPHEQLVHLDRVQLLGNDKTTIHQKSTRVIDSGSPNSTTVDTSIKGIHSLEDVYPVFVDLLLMANGNCVAYGDGGLASSD